MKEKSIISDLLEKKFTSINALKGGDCVPAQRCDRIDPICDCCTCGCSGGGQCDD
jgi:hypothetical protein